MWCGVNWRDLCEVRWSELVWFTTYMSDFVLKWSEVSYGKVLGDKSTMYIRATLHWGHLTVLWLFNLVLSCVVVVLTCFVPCGCVYVWVCVSVGVWVCVCVCVCGRVDLWVCVWVSVWWVCNVKLFWQLYGCFGSMWTCIYCVLYCLYCVFVLFI